MQLTYRCILKWIRFRFNLEHHKSNAKFVICILYISGRYIVREKCIELHLSNQYQSILDVLTRGSLPSFSKCHLILKALVRGSECVKIYSSFKILCQSLQNTIIYDVSSCVDQNMTKTNPRVSMT